MTATSLPGLVPTPTGWRPSTVHVLDQTITAVEPRDATDGPRLLPGFVDVHCHGGGGASFTVGDPDQVTKAAAHHLGQGTTTLVGSTVTDTPEAMLRAVSTLADGVDRGEIAGIHLEGPFLAEAHCGAHDPALLRAPDRALAEELLAAGRGHVRIVTLAAELPGAHELATWLVERGVRPALGHTGAAYDEAHRLASLGGLVTHLFNGMPPLHHRAPGPVGAALAGEAVVELIADGVHLDDATVDLVLSLVGPERVAFVSDAMPAAGLGDGDYVLGPLRVQVRDGVARLAEGGAIAGGTARLADVVRRRLVAGADPWATLTSASATPATLLGLDDRGLIAPGRRADLVVLDDLDGVAAVMRAGSWVSRPASGPARA